MQAVILAGGFGTRLRPLTLNTPKPIVPIGNQPFLLRQINALKKAGSNEIILSLNYQPTAIKEVLGDGSNFGVNLKYVVEPAPMGTAGAYKFTGKHLHTTTIVLNGDILTDIDLQTVIENHEKNEAIATIVLTRVENPSAYGLVETGENGRILRFLEKPKPEEIKKLNINTINAGIYILEPEVLELIPEDEKYSFENQLFPKLLERKGKFYSYTAEDDYWIDIGTHRRYLQAHYDLLSGKIKNFKINRNNNYQSSASAEIDDKSCLANGCRIGSDVKIINSVLGENVIVEDGAVIRNSIIWKGTKIGSQAKISGSIIGLDCSIGKNVSVADSSVLGDKTILANLNI
ncbi:MAG: sugar phosphate nucleotidyltransferase [Aridibacter sp.]